MPTKKTAVESISLDEIRSMFKEEFSFVQEQYENILHEISSLKKSQHEILSDIKHAEEERRELQREVAALRAERKEIVAAVENLQLTADRAEMRQRNRSCRIFNYLPSTPALSDNAKLAKEVFCELIAPALKCAQDKGKLDSVPSWDKVIEWSHMLPQQRKRNEFVNGKKKTRSETTSNFHNPAMIIRFQSRYFFSLFLEFSKPSVTRYNNANSANLFIQPDSTLKMRQCMAKLRNMKDIVNPKRVFIRNGKITFYKVDTHTDTGPHVVINHLASSLEAMLKREPV